MPRRRLPLVVAALLLAAAACGGAPVASDATAPTRSTAAPATVLGTTTTGTPTEPTDEFAAMLAQARTAYGAPGALAMVRRNGSEWFGASGSADLAGTPITPETRFRIASITKPVVAALVLDSVARSELSLDVPVGDLLPETVRTEPAVTLRMLLDHTSGIFDITNEGDPIADIERLADPALREEARRLLDGVEAGGTGIASAPLIVALAETHDRYFAPGAGYHYSNVNYQLAGMVLEAATGRSLSDVLAERIAAPLGLRHTTITPPDVASPEMRGYGTSAEDGGLVDDTDDLLAFGNGGNGGMISTAGDLLGILQAIVSGRIVDLYLVDQMKTPTLESGYSYGLGLGRYRFTCGTFFGHEGGVNGTASIAVVSSDGADGLVIAFNMRNGTDPGLPQLADAMLCSTD